MRCSGGQLACAAASMTASTDGGVRGDARGGLGRGGRPSMHLVEDPVPELGRRRRGPERRASAVCTSAVASPRARAGPVKSSPASTARNATRHASSTPGRNSWAKREVPGRRPPVGQRPLGPHRPDDGGHPATPRLDEGALEDDVGVVAVVQHPEHLGDDRDLRAGLLGPRHASRITDVLDCSPLRTREARTRRRCGHRAWGMPVTRSSTVSDSAEDWGTARPWSSSSSCAA